MNARLILILLMVAWIWSCQNPRPSAEGEPEITMPFLLDTFGFRTTTMNRHTFGVASYLPLYFGELKDTLDVNYAIRHLPLRPPDVYTTDSNGKRVILKVKDKLEPYRFKTEDTSCQKYYPLDVLQHYVSIDSGRIRIIIDTTRTILNLDFAKEQDSTYAFLAYPVLLINEMEDTVEIGYGTHLAIIMEAKDEQEQWVPVERSLSYICRTDQPVIILPPNKVALTSAKIYKGDFETDLRLRLGNNFSRTYRGTIYRTQLRKKSKSNE